MKAVTVDSSSRKNKDKTKEYNSAEMSDTSASNISKKPSKRKNKKRSVLTVDETGRKGHKNRSSLDTTNKVKFFDHDLVVKLCELLAHDFWETAWDLCETRFFNENASVIITSDLRDAWLSIVEMGCLDTEPTLLQPVKFPAYKDSVPLPPKFDFWAKGSLEPLPKAMRESVIDPFIRDMWILGNIEEDELFGSVESSKLDILHLNKDSLQEFSSNEQLVRPRSPIPLSLEGVEEEEECSPTESTWSNASIRGSFANVRSLYLDEKDSTIERLISSPSAKSDASLTHNASNEPTKSRSIEFLYSSKIPTIKASSEILYTRRSRKESEIIAFKLPHQTSSESIREHRERKLRKPTTKTSSLIHLK